MFAKHIRTLLGYGLIVWCQLGTAQEIPQSSQAASFMPTSLNANARSVIVRFADREWDFALSPANSLAAAQGLSNGQTMDLPGHHFMGYLHGNRNSWIRLSYLRVQNRDVLLGALWVNGQFYLIEQSEDFGAGPSEGSYLTLINQGRGGVLLRDWPASLSAEQLEFASIKASGNDWQNLVPRVLPMSIVVDRNYDNHYRGLGVFRAMSVMNIVDGLYRSELGLGLWVQKVVRVDQVATQAYQNNPTLEQLLEDFAHYRRSQNATLAGSGAVHLFSGHSDVHGRVGLAYNNSVCSTVGWDVAVSLPFSRAGLITAHELAHNLGATHDNEAGGSCGQARSLMSARLDDGLGHRLSSCGIKQMAPAINRACVRNQRDIRLNASLDADTGDMHLMVSNQSPYASQVQVQIQTSGGDSAAIDRACSQAENVHTCRVSELEGYAETSLGLTLTRAASAETGQSLMVAQVLNGVDFAASDNQVFVTPDGRVVRIEAGVLPPELTESDVQAGGSAGGGIGVLGLLLTTLACQARASTRRLAAVSVS